MKRTLSLTGLVLVLLGAIAPGISAQRRGAPPDGYKISSVTEAAADLHGHLLIVHGTMDDNVHVQNSIQFVHELQKADKQNFTFMLYPKARHGVRSKHLEALRNNFILEHL